MKSNPNRLDHFVSREIHKQITCILTATRAGASTLYNLYYGKLALNITNKTLRLACYSSQCRARQTDSDILKGGKIAL